MYCRCVDYFIAGKRKNKQKNKIYKNNKIMGVRDKIYVLVIWLALI